MAVAEELERWVTRRTQEEQRKKTLQDRMAHAGFYKSTAVWIFTTGRLVLFAMPIAIGYLAARAGMVPMSQGVIFGLMVGLAGTLAPSFWLDYVKAQRQKQIRRALPDALDVLVVCLEGGLSLSGSFARVARELATAHPMLALEFQIIERQTQMGRTTGEAVRELANRFDLEELRSMARSSRPSGSAAAWPGRWRYLPRRCGKSETKRGGGIGPEGLGEIAHPHGLLHISRRSSSSSSDRR